MLAQALGNLFINSFSEKRAKKKLIFKLIALFLPFIILLGAFIYYEPYDYFGLYNDNRGFSNPNPIPRVRSFLNHPDKTIILIGSSRTAYLDMQTVSEYLDIDSSPANLAFGGASLKEQIDLFWFAVEERSVTEVYFDLSFYSFNKNYAYDRVIPVIQESEDFFMYFKNEEVQKQTRETIKNIFLSKDNSAQRPVRERTAEQKAADMQEDAQTIYNVCSTYVFDNERLADLVEMAKYCEKNSIKLIFMCPPLYQTIWNQVIYPLDLNQYLEKYKTELSQYAPVYDMEYVSPAVLRYDDFTDGFHCTEQTQQEYIQCTFSGHGVNYRLWQNGKIIYFAPEEP